MFTDKKKKREEGVAATLEEDDPGDMAFLKLAKFFWFKVYLAISIALATTELVLIAFPETITVQKVILAAATLLFFIGYGAVMYTMVLEEGTLWTRFKEAFLGEVWIDVAGLIFGWAFIFQNPGIAALRCLRVFRFFWYSEFYRAKKGTMLYPVTFFAHVVVQYLEKVGEELFTTSKSKGGVVVLGFFFFLAYIMAVAVWIYTAPFALMAPEGGNECDTLLHCFLIMLRLTFFDGSGFDFVLSVMDFGDGGLAVLLILYMCLSAFVLLNGLIGIFGSAFASAIEEEDDEDDEDDKDEEKAKETQELELKQTEKEHDPKDLASTLSRVEAMCVQLKADLTELKSRLPRQ